MEGDKNEIKEEKVDEKEENKIEENKIEENKINIPIPEPEAKPEHVVYGDIKFFDISLKKQTKQEIDFIFKKKDFNERNKALKVFMKENDFKVCNKEYEIVPLPGLNSEHIYTNKRGNCFRLRLSGAHHKDTKLFFNDEPFYLRKKDSKNEFYYVSEKLNGVNELLLLKIAQRIHNIKEAKIGKLIPMDDKNIKVLYCGKNGDDHYFLIANRSSVVNAEFGYKINKSNGYPISINNSKSGLNFNTKDYNKIINKKSNFF